MHEDSFETDRYICITVSTYKIGHCSYYPVCFLKSSLFREKNCEIIWCRKNMINIKNNDQENRYKCKLEKKHVSSTDIQDFSKKAI